MSYLATCEDKPDGYRGVATDLLEFDPGPDPGQWLWDHRRGILQGASVAAGVTCIAVTAGFCAPSVGTLAAANIGQSAQDNLSGDEKCWGNFGISVVTNGAPLGVNRLAGQLPGGLYDAARTQAGSMFVVGSAGSEIDTCAGG